MPLSLSGGDPDMGGRDTGPEIRPTQPSVDVETASKSPFEWAQLASAWIGMGLITASAPDRTAANATRAAETSKRPARSRSSPPQCTSQPKLRSTVKAWIRPDGQCPTWSQPRPAAWGRFWRRWHRCPTLGRASRSSPAAAERGAVGAGLEGGAPWPRQTGEGRSSAPIGQCPTDRIPTFTDPIAADDQYAAVALS